jgi:very-short-patch-repair endonuclease
MQPHMKLYDNCISFGEAALANENARALRKRLTPQEVKLWVKLRELKPLGFHFRRQAPLGRYIVDFVSFGSKLIVEADGGQHGMAQGRQIGSGSRRIVPFGF